MTTRRTVLKGVAASAGLLAAPALVRAQAYPGGQTIKVVVPFAPGGTTDITGRILADRWSQMWNTSVVVENVTGAQGNVALDRVAKSTPNGTNIVICTPAVTTNQFLYPRMPFDPEKDLAYLSQTVRIPNLLVVRNSLPVKTVPELIAYGKENKGKLNYGSPGVGSSGHLSAEIFKRAMGIEMAHVPYRGSALALNDLVAGNIDLIFENIPSCINLVRGGQIRGVAVTSPQKYALAPDYPPVSETVADFDVSAFFGVAVPSGTPAEIRKVIEDSAVAVAKEEPVRKRLAELTAETIGSNAQEFSAYIVSERQRWGRIIKDLGIRME